MHTPKDMVAPLLIIVPVLVVAVACWALGYLNDWPWMGVIAGVGADLARGHRRPGGQEPSGPKK